MLKSSRSHLARRLRAPGLALLLCSSTVASAAGAPQAGGTLAGGSLTGGTLAGGTLAGAPQAGRSAAARAVGSPALTPEADFLAQESRRMEALVQHEGERQAQARASFPAFFEEAYQRYPRVPEGVLEAAAFVGSRWVQRIPAGPTDGLHGMPQVYGVMGLHHGYGGFRDVLGEAAAALGVDEGRVRSDARTNILAAAALLDRYLAAQGLSYPRPEEAARALAKLSGIPETSAVDRFARDSYVYDVLLNLDRGVDENGIDIRAQAVDWLRVFQPETLALLRAPLVRINADHDRVEAPGFHIDPISQTLVADGGASQASQASRASQASQASQAGRAANGSMAGASERTQSITPAATVDYPPALWVASPNYSSRSGSAITHVAIHTVQGSYSSCISWFQNTSSQVSAHYVVRSSDGQVTQMVRESNKAWHIGSENPYTLGTEHEGYVDTSSYYTTAMYNSSAALTKDMCASNKIDCNTCFPGPAKADVDVQSNNYHIKGHQHYQNQSHNDPGQYWDWTKYKSLIATTSGGGGTTTPTKTVLDSFETSEGHFNTDPTYSGSTVGISTSSTADRSTGTKKVGSYSEAVKLLDSSATTAAWEVRFLSGSGSSSQNTALTRSGGKVGFWVYTAASGVSVGLGVDDSDGTERSVKKTVPASTWTFVEWSLTDATQWDSWSGGNGQLDASTVTLDAIWIFRAQTTSTVYVYLDDVTYTKS